MTHIKYRASPTLNMFTYSYYIYYNIYKVLTSYNNIINTIRTMPNDTGPYCMTTFVEVIIVEINAIISSFLGSTCLASLIYDVSETFFLY